MSATGSRSIAKALFVALAVVSTAAGCGSGGEGSATAKEQRYSIDGRTYAVEADTTVTTGSVDKSRFVPHVNQICREAWAIVQKNFNEYLSWQNQHLPRRVRIENTIKSSLLAGIDFHIFDEIHGLQAPDGEQAIVEELIGAMQAAVEHGEKLRMHSLRRVAALFSTFNRRALGYGVDDCLVDANHVRI